MSQEAPRKLLKDEPEPVEGEIIAPVKRYLRKESALATALGYKWLGIDAGENGKGEKVGEALAWTKEAQSRLGEMEDSKMREKMKGLGIGKSNERKKEERKARNSRVDREVEDIAAWVKAYSRMNDTVRQDTIELIAGLISAHSANFDPLRSCRKTNLCGQAFQTTTEQVRSPSAPRRGAESGEGG